MDYRGGGGGGIWSQVKLAWEIWRFNLPAKFTSEIQGSSQILLPRLRRKRI